VIPSNGRPRLSRRAGAAVAAALLSVGLLAGCGGSSDDAGPPAETTLAPSPTVTVPALPADKPQRPACGLLTQAEVEAAIGTRVNPGKEALESARSVCTYNPASSPGESVLVVAVTSSGVPAFFKTARERMNGPQAVTAGDEAFISGGQGLVRRGDTMVAVIVALKRELPQLAALATKMVQSAATHI
jgi:hypothetical protein